jgi:hypothetical protein
MKYSIDSIYRNEGYVFFFGLSIATVAQRVHLYHFDFIRSDGAMSDVV